MRFECREGLVSALVASPTEQDKVQALQRALYRAAKADPERRFHTNRRGRPNAGGERRR